jgi:hypothetical protein
MVAGFGRSPLAGVGRRSATAGGLLPSKGLPVGTMQWPESRHLPLGHVTDRSTRGQPPAHTGAYRGVASDCGDFIAADGAGRAQQQCYRQRNAYLLPTDAMTERLEGRVVPAAGALKGLFEVP